MPVRIASFELLERLLSIVAHSALKLSSNGSAERIRVGLVVEVLI